MLAPLPDNLFKNCQKWHWSRTTWRVKKICDEIFQLINMKINNKIHKLANCAPLILYFNLWLVWGKKHGWQRAMSFSNARIMLEFNFKKQTHIGICIYIAPTCSLPMGLPQPVGCIPFTRRCWDSNPRSLGQNNQRFLRAMNVGKREWSYATNIKVG